MSARRHEAALFIETQHLTQVWLWVPILIVSGVGWWAFVQQVLLNRPFGNNPAPDGAVIVLWILIGLGLPLLIGVSHLRVIVLRDAVILRYFPFWTRRVALEQIVGCRARTYHPVREYAGWGIRYGLGRGWVYSVKGNRGVQLELQAGRPLLIRKQRPEELAAAINAARV